MLAGGSSSPAAGAGPVRSQVLKKFKQNSMYLRGPATKLLVDTLIGFNLNVEQVGRAIDMVITEVNSVSSVESGAVDEVAIQQVLDKLQNKGEVDDDGGVREKSLQVIDAFDVPRFNFSLDRKRFVPAKHAPVLHPSDPRSKAAVCCERYSILRHRTMSNPLFVPAVEGLSDNSDKFQLTPLSALLGYKGLSKMGGSDLIVIGMLSQLEEGKLFLEDLDGHVQIDISRAATGIGLLTENSIVMAEGKFEDDVFYAQTIGFPPPEALEQSRISLGSLNLFGGEVSAHERQRLLAMEVEDEEVMLVVLSEVHLDQPVVLSKLKALFNGFSGMPTSPTFVLMGNFLSQQYGVDNHRVLKESMSQLTDIVTGFEDIASRSTFIFVPGPKDPGGAGILPRRSLPADCTERFRNKVANAKFSTNPARVRYCTQEMVFFREDVVNKMRRNSLRPPQIEIEGEQLEISAHVVKTLLDQAHLCPLPLQTSPVYWEFDHAMRLYPMPDVLVLGDKFDAYNLTYEGCTAFNPGAFSTADFGFMVYWPSRAKIDPNESDQLREEYDSRVQPSKVP